MGLKKIFPVIFVLITLSLVGIIYIQINWIVTMIENKQEEIQHHTIDAVRTVAEGLSAQRASAPTFKSLRLKPGTSWRPTEPLIMELMRIPLITQTFSEQEINNRLRKAFNNAGLANARFEFSVMSDMGSSDLNYHTPPVQSPNFVQEFNDLANNPNFFVPIQAPENTASSTVLPDVLMLSVIAFGVLFALTPSVGNAPALARAIDTAHHAAYPGPGGTAAVRRVPGGDRGSPLLLRARGGTSTRSPWSPPPRSPAAATREARPCTSSWPRCSTPPARAGSAYICTFKWKSLTVHTSDTTIR